MGASAPSANSVRTERAAVWRGTVTTSPPAKRVIAWSPTGAGKRKRTRTGPRPASSQLPSRYSRGRSPATCSADRSVPRVGPNPWTQ